MKTLIPCALVRSELAKHFKNESMPCAFALTPAALPGRVGRVPGAAVPRGQPRRVRPHVEAQLARPHRRQPRRAQGLQVQKISDH